MVVGLKNLPYSQRSGQTECGRTYNGAADAARALSDGVSEIKA